MKILFVGANGRSTSDLRIRHELRDVRQEIERAPYALYIEIREELAARPMDLMRRLGTYTPDFVHFSGHGVRGQGHHGASNKDTREFEPSTEAGSAGEILLEDDSGNVQPVSARMLAKLVEDPWTPRCVILNACHTTEVARELAEHVDQVIGMKHAISDQRAIQFACGFYQNLANGWPVDIAFDKACALIPDDIAELHYKWKVRLANLFANHYTNRELLMFMNFQLGVVSAEEVLGDEQEHRRNAERVVEWIAEKGAASDTFFRNLARAPYAYLKAEIDEINNSWRRVTKGNSWFPSGPGSKPSKPGLKGGSPVPAGPPSANAKDPTPPPPPVKPLKVQKPPKDPPPSVHTHTSVVLDRIEQWQSLVAYCKENKRPTHRLIIMHGSSQQNVGLFIRRIKSYLAAASKQEHEIVKVLRTNDISVARTCEEWKRCIRRAILVKHGELRDSLVQITSKMPILMLFTHDNSQPLTPFDDDTSLNGLVQAIQNLDMCLHYKGEHIKHSVRIVLPFEINVLRGQTLPPLVPKLGRLEALRVTSLPELVFPPWEPDISKFIRETYNRADERILEKCKAIYTEVARTDQSLKHLSDRLDDAMHDWMQRTHDF